MYKKLYEQPFFAIMSKPNSVITMSGGTGFDDGNDNVIGRDEFGGVSW